MSEGKDRTRARELASSGDPLGWFERLYAESQGDASRIPWADLEPNRYLMQWREFHPHDGTGKRALVIGCGLGDDAEEIARWGYQTTAFDLSPTAIDLVRKRFTQSPVIYSVADVLQPPPEWLGAFDLVFEAFTVQTLPHPLRAQAIASIRSVVAAGGELIVVARLREETDPPGEFPWPLTPSEFASFEQLGLKRLSSMDCVDDGVRRRLVHLQA